MRTGRASMRDGDQQRYRASTTMRTGEGARPETDPVRAAPPSRLLRKLSAVLTPGAAELRALAEMCGAATRLDARVELVLEGDSRSTGYIFEQGWGCRYRLLNDGRRQILNFILPGDCVGASSNVMHATDYSVATVTPAVVHAFSPPRLTAFQCSVPALKAAFEWSIRRDYSMLQERLVDLGRRDARERVAHMLMEFLERLHLVGLTGGMSYDLPLTQEMLADALGLSHVHVNRTLRRLNREGVIRYQPGHVTILRPERLAAIAEFETGYLHQPPTQPRLDAVSP